MLLIKYIIWRYLMAEIEKFTPDPNLKLMDQVVQVLRYHHYAYRTEKIYCDWIVRFLKYFNYEKHPKEMGKMEIEQFLSYLATDKKVSAATQQQATTAIIFLFREVLHIDVSDKIQPIKAQKRNPLPVVMSMDEVMRLISQLSGNNLLIAKLLYGSGLRLMEAIRLRVKDLDFENNLISVYDGKRMKNRISILPMSLHSDLKIQIQKVKNLHDNDLKDGFGAVWLPDALETKYPNAPKEIQWQYLFPSTRRSIDPRSGIERRHHIQEITIQRAVKLATKSTNLNKRVSCHTFRHCFATHLLEKGANIRMVQKLMGHSDIKTTEIYLHLLDTKMKVKSPLDYIFSG
ncbi:MAG: site-specific recombinase XerD [Candidatus Magnetoglobus multicellularis str. Araruama]|uniref:Site-specific recombinase XerD n=1 Tax=Candidatus Magnetoglobus multicellularis str. Araruama TaxID=890399 RepID=A0A1V1P5J8_9BACT|nr:MAG: site-specific recombinase XerD [Candidatus Magnetoglobus multicellularis str. Araruama]